MGSDDYTIEFSGLCIVHVTPDGEDGKRATAYLLNSGDHCARLTFPLSAVGPHKWPNGSPSIVDVPGQPLYLSLDIHGLTVTFDGLSTSGVEFKASNKPQAHPRITDWSDLDYALDLAYVSGERKLDPTVLSAHASAVVLLPRGTLTAMEPMSPALQQQTWEVFSPSGSRIQGLSDRMRLAFKSSTTTVRLRFNGIGSGELALVGGAAIGLSSLCKYQEVYGMPDVADYNLVLQDKQVRQPVEVASALSANSTRCPPTWFGEGGD